MPNSKLSALWIVIPVRSYKTGVEKLARKNLRALAGKSLITRAVETARACLAGQTGREQIVVVVDDAETAEVASRLNVEVVQLNSIDSDLAVASALLGQLKSLGAQDSHSVVVLNPALPLISPIRISEANRALQDDFESVSLAYEDQAVLGFTATRLANFAQPNPASRQPHLTIQVTEPEAVFIDSQTDWAVADYFASRKRILIRTDVSEVLDPSHAARAVALSDALATHNVSLVISSQQSLNEQYFRGLGADLIPIDDDLDLLAVARKENADLVILDKHLNSAEFVTLLNGFCKVVTVEDFGEGAQNATLTFNTLFDTTHVDPERKLTNSDAQLLPVDFESAEIGQHFSPIVREIVICFSGQDMNSIASRVLRALDSLGFDLKVTVVRGLGSDLIDPKAYNLKLTVLSNVRDFASIFKSADLAISSADFNLPMLIAAGVPTLALAQNTAEVLNAQARLDRGVLTLGFGSLMSEETLAAHLDRLIEDADLREAMHERAIASVGGRTNQKAAKRLLSRIGF